MRTVLFLLAIGPALAVAQVPVTFQPGTPALAAEVNQNFQNLNTRVNTNLATLATLDGRIDASIGTIIISGVNSSDVGVAAATCPVDRIAISANCDCDSENSTRNFGVLFLCQVAGNGGVAGCFPEGSTFDPLLPPPLATIVVGCVSATTNDGEPIDPVPIFLKGGAVAQKSSDNAAYLNASEDFDSALKSTLDQLADYMQKMRSTQ